MAAPPKYHQPRMLFKAPQLPKTTARSVIVESRARSAPSRLARISGGGLRPDKRSHEA